MKRQLDTLMTTTINDILCEDIINIIISLSGNNNCILVCKQWYNYILKNSQTCTTCNKIVKIYDIELYSSDDGDIFCHSYYGPLEDYKILKYILAYKPYFFKNIKRQTKSICLEAVKYSCNNFEYVRPEYITEELCLKFIKNKDYLHEDEISKLLQTEKVCIAIVRKSPYYLPLIKNKTTNVYMEAVIKDSSLLKYVKEQTKELCLIAVKQNGNALEHVINQTDEICLEAVKNNGNALQYVKKQTDEICLEAIKQNGNALQYVKKQTKEMCTIAVIQNGCYIYHVREQDEDLCMIAVEKNGYNLQNIYNQTEKVCLKAISKHHYNLEYVKEQTDIICIEALKKNIDALRYIKIKSDAINEYIAINYPKYLICVKNPSLKEVINAFRNNKYVIDYVDGLV
jgi:hypothetical protein